MSWLMMIAMAGIGLAFATLMSFIMIPIMVDFAYGGVASWTNVSQEALDARDRTIMLWQVIPFIILGLIIVYAVKNSAKQEADVYSEEGADF